MKFLIYDSHSQGGLTRGPATRVLARQSVTCGAPESIVIGSPFVTLVARQKVSLLGVLLLHASARQSVTDQTL